MATCSLTPQVVAAISQRAKLPEKSQIQQAARCLADDDRIIQVLMSLGPQFQSIPRGSLSNVKEQFTARIGIRYQSKFSEQPGGLSRDLIIALAGAYRTLLLPQRASVQITNAQEPSPLAGGSHPRQRLHIALDALIEDSFTKVVGTIESVKFAGYIKIPSDGLCCSVSILFTDGGRFDESFEESVALMQNSAERRGGPLPSVVRKLRGLFHPGKLVKEYDRTPHLFPRVRSRKQFEERAETYCAELDNFINALRRNDVLCTFMEAACCTTLDADIEDYCKLHFGLPGINHGYANDMVSLLKTSLMAECQKPLREGRRMAVDILPFERSQCLHKTIDAILRKHQPACNRQDQSTNTRNLACVDSMRCSSFGSSFASPGGNEEVIVFELKHSRISEILRNLGFNLLGEYTTEATLQWKDSSCLSADQQVLKDLALQMCFDENSTIMLKSGVLVFVSPAICRDVPDMLKELKEQGNRVGQGVLLVSEHLLKLVWNVLNPREFDRGSVKSILPPDTPKNTCFPRSKKGTVVILPGAPGGQFREQGLASAKTARNSHWSSAPDRTAHLHVHTETHSVESRFTRSTGDLPKQATTSRPNTCDRQQRQSLKGVLREDGLRRHRDSPTNLSSSSAHALVSNNVKIVTRDSFKELEITRQHDVTALATMIVPKLTEAKAKGAASKFLMASVASLQGELTLQDAEAVHTVVKQLVARREMAKHEERNKEGLQQRKKEHKQWEAKAEKTLGRKEVSDEKFFKDFM